MIIEREINYCILKAFKLDLFQTILYKLISQETLSQPRGADYAHQIMVAPPDFQTFLRPWDISIALKIGKKHLPCDQKHEGAWETLHDVQEVLDQVALL